MNHALAAALRPGQQPSGDAVAIEPPGFTTLRAAESVVARLHLGGARAAIEVAKLPQPLLNILSTAAGGAQRHGSPLLRECVSSYITLAGAASRPDQLGLGIRDLGNALVFSPVIELFAERRHSTFRWDSRQYEGAFRYLPASVEQGWPRNPPPRLMQRRQRWSYGIHLIEASTALSRTSTDYLALPRPEREYAVATGLALLLHEKLGAETPPAPSVIDVLARHADEPERVMEEVLQRGTLDPEVIAGVLDNVPLGCGHL